MAINRKMAAAQKLLLIFERQSPNWSATFKYEREKNQENLFVAVYFENKIDRFSFLTKTPLVGPAEILEYCPRPPKRRRRALPSALSVVAIAERGVSVEELGETIAIWPLNVEKHRRQPFLLKAGGNIDAESSRWLAVVDRAAMLDFNAAAATLELIERRIQRKLAIAVWLGWQSEMCRLPNVRCNLN